MTHTLYSSEEEISVALQRYLEVEIQRRDIPDFPTPSDFLEILLSSRANMQVWHCTNGDYLNRIAQVAYERYNARRIDQEAPTLAIFPAPLARQQIDDLLGDRLNYVMVFGAESIYFQDTVHALAVDSYCSERVNVLGTHIDWLSRDSESIERAIIVGKTGLVKEVAFDEPVPIHIAHILHLPLRQERELHQGLSDRFSSKGVQQINPYRGSSERADDKAWTHVLWERYNQKAREPEGQYGQRIVSPKHVLISQISSSREIAAKLCSLGSTHSRDVVIQPNKGTEGYKVEKFFVEADFKSAQLLPIVRYIKDRILPEDDAIVREKRGNVRYTGDPSGSFLNVTFRVNVAWNGSEFVAESGYAQIARDDRTFPASRGRGGVIVDINKALANLYSKQAGGMFYFKQAGSMFYSKQASGMFYNTSGERWIRFIPTYEDIAAMKATAINAAYGLNAGLEEKDYLKLMGIDILLEVEGTETEAINVIPVALEANPRPAGLSHSTDIVGIWNGRPQPVISKELFKFIES